MCLVVAVPMTNDWKLEKWLLLLVLSSCSFFFDHGQYIPPFSSLPATTLRVDVNLFSGLTWSLWMGIGSILLSASLCCLPATQANSERP
jgi:hypothetical protein